VQSKLKTLDRYFNVQRGPLRNTTFGMIVSYATGARGAGRNRHWRPAAPPPALDQAARLTATHPGRYVILVALEKRFDRRVSGLRASSNEYYSGALEHVLAYAFRRGQCVDTARVYP
jgi:hypothetical protein